VYRLRFVLCRGDCFSIGGLRAAGEWLSEFAPSKTPDVVCERGLVLCEALRDTSWEYVTSNGDEGDELSGLATCEEVVDDVVVKVWYVRTGSRSTTDFGALHLRRRIRDLSSNKA
jgi:hypothetical protein